MNPRKPAAVPAPKDGVSPWTLKTLGAALAAALLVVLGGVSLASLTNEPGALLTGGLAGVIVASVLFLRRRLAIMSTALLAILLILTFPVMAPGTRDARRAEAEQMLGSLKDMVRVAHARSEGDKNIRTLTGPIGSGGCGVTPAKLAGKYFRVLDEVVITDAEVALRAEPQPGYLHDGSCTFRFAWDKGDGWFDWRDPRWFEQLGPGFG